MLRKARAALFGGREAASMLASIGTLAAVLVAFSALQGGSAGPTTAQAELIIGVADVLDGDTVEIAQRRIRLHGIDAAEEDQRCRAASGSVWNCAQAATARLRALTGSGQATCKPVGRDKYDRVLALCRVGGIDV